MKELFKKHSEIAKKHNDEMEALYKKLMESVALKMTVHDYCSITPVAMHGLSISVALMALYGTCWASTGKQAELIGEAGRIEWEENNDKRTC